MSFNIVTQPTRTLLLIAASTFSASVASDTRTYAATTDFPNIDAGEVPYYSEAPNRPSLAIDAAIEEFRDLFARAEVVYDGNEGVHDITLVALAELDGEAEYRLFINDELIGTASNPEVSVDYTVVRHIFEDVTVPVGAVLAVESLANTNGKIPEGDGTAFARGRWTQLELLEDVPDEAPVVIAPSDIDLDFTISAEQTRLDLNEDVEIELTLSNLGDSSMATQPIVSLTFPQQSLAVLSAAQCVENIRDMTCRFSEIAAGETQSMVLLFAAREAGAEFSVQATAEADQTDRDGRNNAGSVDIEISAPMIVQVPSPTETTPGQNQTPAETTPGSSQTQTATVPSTNQSQSGTGAEAQTNATAVDTEIPTALTRGSSGGGALSLLALLLVPAAVRRWISR